MSLEELWPKLEVNTPTSVNIPFYVSKIEAYLADPVSCRTWKIKLARKGWKMEYIFLHDLIMYTAEGKQIRMLEHPSLQIVHNGTLQEGNIIIATSIIKIKMPAYDAELFYIVLKDWISHPNPTQVEKIYRGIHSLPGYVPSTRLLGSYTG
ncbi:uncharacterized protein LOC111705653, partial [Eurytemora carolleeae]|uniref:uncharacterized protein LOC111705653 n=1 Tax=Eurytemora carolleeae TaxID=1294199 RepID=UPI000C75DF73